MILESPLVICLLKEYEFFYGRNPDEPAGTSDSSTAWNDDEG